MISKEGREVIRAQYDAIVNMHKDIGIHHRYNAAMEVYANIPALLDALDAETKRADEAETMRDFWGKEVIDCIKRADERADDNAMYTKRIEVDRDRWKERAEALERTFKESEDICWACMLEDTCPYMVCECEDVDSGHPYFQFDEASFAASAAGGAD